MTGCRRGKIGVPGLVRRWFRARIYEKTQVFFHPVASLGGESEDQHARADCLHITAYAECQSNSIAAAKCILVTTATSALLKIV
jgi:hypothetical protein